MSKRILISGLSCLALLVGLIVALRWSIAADEPFHISGALSEACTCSVPCTCSFGEGPSPHNYCHTVYAYGIKEGNYNGVKLDGLKFGGMETAKGNALYLDDSASPEQRKALEALARKVTRVSGDRMGSGPLLERFATVFTGRQAVRYEERQRHGQRSEGLLINAQVAGAIGLPTSQEIRFCCRDTGYWPAPPPIGFYTSAGLVNPTGGSRWIVHSQPTEDQKDSHNPTGGSRWIVHSQPLLLVVERTGRE